MLFIDSCLEINRNFQLYLQLQLIVQCVMLAALGIQNNRFDP